MTQVKDQLSKAATAITDKLPASGGRGVAAAAASVAAAVVGTIAVRAIRKKSDATEDDSIFHLKQKGDVWVLEIEGSDAPEATFQTKDEGMTAARELARQSSPCELIIYRTDGSEQDRHSYEA